jgi:hypothetical protein
MNVSLQEVEERLPSLYVITVHSNVQSRYLKNKNYELIN